MTALEPAAPSTGRRSLLRSIRIGSLVLAATSIVTWAGFTPAMVAGMQQHGLDVISAGGTVAMMFTAAVMAAVFTVSPVKVTFRLGAWIAALLLLVLAGTTTALHSDPTFTGDRNWAAPVLVGLLLTGHSFLPFCVIREWRMRVRALPAAPRRPQD
ncbi:hypothetical protein ACH4E7_40730 [Kitasatospora sp. NPDC018058]|uniref:hypothetical protein n=1 Tax=Kitasatospora sp. NPDC018058 TaxID=3364025 RepID=UPI0037BFC6BA